MVKLPRRMRRDTKLSLLAASPALAGCRPADLVEVAANADLVAYEEGDLLAFQEDPRRRWWLVLDGSVDLLWNCSWPSHLDAGQAFGLDAPAASPERLTVVAAAPGHLLVAGRGALLALVDRRPRVAAAVRRASVDLVGEEFEELLRRASDDRAIPADHDRTLDQHRVGGESVEQLVPASSSERQLGEAGLARAGDRQRVVGAEHGQHPFELGSPRRLP
jgi:hypothetical protein